MVRLRWMAAMTAAIVFAACGPGGGSAPTGTGGASAAGGAAAGAGGSTGGGSGGSSTGGATTATGGGTGRGETTGTGGSPGTGGVTTVPTDAGRVDLNGRKALLVVGSPGSLDDGEIVLQQVLDEHGMIVTVAPATGPAALATGQDVVIASDLADAATFAATFSGIGIPIIAFSNSHFVSLGWIGKNAKGTASTSTLLAMAGAPTPLSSDFAAGATFLGVVASTSASYYWGTPGGAAILVASVMGDATEVVVFAYAAGASTGTATVPARRVGLGFKTNVIQNLTVEGFKLLEAALDWTAAGM